jgi:ABC-type branched-subunit amino acid transport system substrate-binding protein
VKINGVYHKVELIMIGDDSNVDKVRHVHRYLCQQGITLMFAPYSSGLTKIAAQEANACGALMIAPNAASTSVFTGHPLVFGTTTPATKYVVPAFEAVGTMVTSMAVFYEEGGFTGIDSGACSVAQTQAARKGIYYTQTNDVDAFVIPSDPTAADFTRIVNGLKTAGKNGQPPDFILGCVYAAACDSILQEMERQQFSVKITMSMQCVTASDFMRKVGEGGRYIGGIAPWMTTMHLPSDFGNWSAASYSSEYEYRFGELPSYQAASSWASAEIMISSIEKANSVNQKRSPPC